MTEDREQTTNEDREQTAQDVEGHSLTGGLVGQTTQTTAHTDDDEPDVEAHNLIGQTGAGQTTN